MRGFFLRDHPGKIIVAAPCAAAAVSIAVATVEPMLGKPLPLSGIANVVLVLNLLFAAAGSAIGGLLIRGTTGERIGAAVVTSVAGLLLYIAITAALEAVILPFYELGLLFEART